ncbi:MAG: hypothetical protein M0Z51_16830 [Propionibacterium sp.]|nr:hypothetical protein [Propionibacterium sp.]
MNTTRTADQALETSAQLIETIASRIPAAKVRTDIRGQQSLSISKGSLLTTIRPEVGGVRVVRWIDYGVDGRNLCDARTFRSAAGAIKFATA